MNRRLKTALLGMAIASIVGASPNALQELVANSPFGKAPAASAASGTVPDAPLEFRGVFSDAGESFFSIYDVASRRSTWVGLNEPGQGYVVKAYNEAQGTLTVEFQGRVLAIALKQAKVVALPPASVPPMSVASAQSGQAATTPAVAPAPPADEAARLARIAEEIRRRRAARAQAMQQNGQTPSATNTAPQLRPANQ